MRGGGGGDDSGGSSEQTKTSLESLGYLGEVEQRKCGIGFLEPKKILQNCKKNR